jgi:hypothetical protein
MPERRTTGPRRRIYRAATIELPGGGSMTGYVKNLSDTGAMIEVGTIVGIPEKFTLVIESADFKRECKIVWRQPTRVGVHFL